jgi:hypothetical protein
MFRINCKEMKKEPTLEDGIQAYQEQQFERAVIEAENAKLRRKFPTTLKLLLNPSDELCEKYPIKVYYNRQNERALMYPNGEREDQYGYTEGIPDEDWNVYQEEEEYEDQDFEWHWNVLEHTKTQKEDDYELLENFKKWISQRQPTDITYDDFVAFLSSTQWGIFRGYIMEDK